MSPELPSPFAMGQDSSPPSRLVYLCPPQLTARVEERSQTLEACRKDSRTAVGAGTLSDSPQPRWLVPTPLRRCCELWGHHVLGDRLYLPSTLDSGFPGAPTSVRPSPWSGPFAPWSGGLPQNNRLGTERGPEGLIALLPLNCSLLRPVLWLWSAGIQ